MRHLLPYSNLSQEELSALGVAELVRAKFDIDDEGPHFSGVPVQDGSVFCQPLEEIARDLQELGHPIACVMLVRDELQPKQALAWTISQTTAVDVAAGTMDILPSATTQVMDRSNRATAHICKL